MKIKLNGTTMVTGHNFVHAKFMAKLYPRIAKKAAEVMARENSRKVDDVMTGEPIVITRKKTGNEPVTYKLTFYCRPNGISHSGVEHELILVQFDWLL